MALDEKKERFLTFINEQNGAIRKLCRGYSNSLEDFEDNIQEVYYQIWKSIDKFEGRSQSGTWVYRLTLNVCLYNLDKRKKRKEQAFDNGLIAEKSDTQAELFDKNSPVTVLYESISLLNPIDRAIIMLYLEKKNHGEIAEIMGLSTANIGVKVHRIKKQLKDIVNERA